MRALEQILDEFVRAATEIIDSKEHGLPTKSALSSLKRSPEDAIEAFYARYIKTKEKFDSRSNDLISGAFWMRPRASREKIWSGMESCKSLALEYACTKRLSN